MQLMRTEVEATTSPTGDLIQLVRFCGEGGECVTVEMAPREGSAYNEAAALDRARASLVQTAAFDVASNVYDAESNGQRQLRPGHRDVLRGRRRRNLCLRISRRRKQPAGSFVQNAKP